MFHARDANRTFKQLWISASKERESQSVRHINISLQAYWQAVKIATFFGADAASLGYILALFPEREEVDVIDALLPRLTL